MAKNVKRKIEKINWPEFATGIFILVMMLVFPLYFHNAYADILNAKYGFFLIAAGLLIVDSLFYELTGKGPFKGWFTKLNILDWAFIGFAGILTICMLQSYPYMYESFFGSEGRYCGYAYWMLICLSYFVVSRTMKFKKYYIYAFLLSGSLVGLIAIFNYFDIDIIGIKSGLSSDFYYTFSTTIGNIDTVTGFLAIPFALAGALFVFNKEKIWHSIAYVVCFAVASVSLIVAQADNAYLSFMCFFILVPFIAWKTRAGFRRYFLSVSVWLSTMLLVGYWNSAYAGRVIFGGSLLNSVLAVPHFKLIVVACWVITAVIYAIDILKKVSIDTPMPKFWFWAWTGLVAAGFVVVVALIVKVNVSGYQLPGPLSALQSVFEYNDHWGSGRGYVWRASFENYANYPFIHQVFGTGPDTSGIFMMNWKYDEMVAITGVLFDSPHSAWIQMFVTIGPFGFVFFMGVFITTAILAWKNRLKANAAYMLAIACAVLCHLFQSVVNIMTPIDYPAVFVLIMIAGAMFRRADEA